MKIYRDSNKCKLYGGNIFMSKDNDGDDDDDSEGFFLQCGVVPASIMPTSDPLSAPFALHCTALHYTAFALHCIAVLW